MAFASSLNLIIERTVIGTQENGSPLFRVRIIRDGFDPVLTDEQRAKALDLLATFDPPAPKVEAPPKVATKPPASDK